MSVTDKDAGSDRSTHASDDTPRRRRHIVSMRQLRDGQALVRNKLAGLIWFAVVLCAAVLAIGAVLVALGANPDNVVYQWFTDSAEALAGPLDNLFQLDDDAKTTLVNWGIAAVGYLVVGKVVVRIVRV